MRVAADSIEKHREGEKKKKKKEIILMLKKISGHIGTFFYQSSIFVLLIQIRKPLI